MNSPFVASFSTVIVSEIGDRVLDTIYSKTFIIAAILGSKYSKSVAFIAAFSALFLQVILMCTLGKFINLTCRIHSPSLVYSYLY
jgi:putative Ca2+/H+ antiporter (TMEM165/GDT1 family)